MADIFLEYLVKKNSKEDSLKKLLIGILCGVILVLSFFLLTRVFYQFIWLLPIIWGGAIYGTVILCRNYSIEFEYIFTNGMLDIDIIQGKAKRKSLASISCRNIEHMAPLNTSAKSDRTEINAIYDERRRGKYYLDYSVDGKKMRLLLQPPEKILENIKRYNPRNVDL